MITIYGMHDSGNCYKPRLLCALLGEPFHHIEISTPAGETHTPEFLALNPNGQVPLLKLVDGTLVTESNAILWYLGEGSRFVPQERVARAQMLSWMFFEQYNHEPTVAVRRSLLVYAHRKDRATPERLAATLAGGEAALGLMEQQLAESPYLVGDTPSLADISLYPYTHVAHEGGFDLDKWPAIKSWIARIEALDGYRPVTWLPKD